MSVSFFLSFVQYFFIMAYTPGPSNLLSMNISMRYGLKKFLKVYSGLYVAFAIIVVTSAFISYQFSHIIPQLTSALTVIGALYILWLALHIFRSKPFSIENNQPQHNDCSFLTGFLMNITNVKVMIFCISLFQMFLLKYYNSLGALLCWCLPISIFGTGSTIVWAILGHRLANSYSRHFRIYNTIMALLLMSCVLELF